MPNDSKQVQYYSVMAYFIFFLKKKKTLFLPYEPSYFLTITKNQQERIYLTLSIMDI